MPLPESKLVKKEFVSVFKLWIWNECDRGRRSLTATGLPGWSSNDAAGRSCEIRDVSEGSDVKVNEDSEACIAYEESVETGKEV